MPALQKRWRIAPKIPGPISGALKGYSPILQQLLFNRGIRDAEEAQNYLAALPPAGTEPQRMMGIPAAVERIRKAILSGENIAIYGDYDVDGVTATALLTGYLRDVNADVRGYIPNRFDEGYGLNNEALESLFKAGTRLVITVDCGIRSPDEADYARQLGLDLIITDHHQPGQTLPDAVAVINPKQAGCLYPEKDLAGVGLAYKLACALDEVFSPGMPRAAAYLDLVALGTVADLAPLNGENRSLVRAGLQRLRQPTRQGLLSLIQIAGLKRENLNTTDIGFMLGPRLNAAGRLDSALAALQLLTTDDLFEAGRLAQQLEIQNRDRQLLTQKIQEQAEILAIQEDPAALLLFAAHPEFNSGVVGLAASRLVERFYRPAIVAQQGNEYTRGSCRSIPEFHITQALDECADLLLHHGGHAAAAGFTLINENLPEFRSRLQAIARRELKDLDLRPVLEADMELSLARLHPALLDQLELLQPTGHGNRQAIFVTRGVRVGRSRAVGRENAHLKLTVSGDGLTFDAIAFRLGHLADALPEHVDLMYTFETNEYNGRVSLQLNVRDLKPSGLPDD